MEAVFTLLNATALLGWSAVLASLVLQSMGSSSLFPGGVSLSSSPFAIAADDDSEGAAPPVVRALLFLEAICLVEVGRIALGQLRGNLVLGAVLHAIRATCLCLVLPDGLSSSSSSSDGDADEDSLFPSQRALSVLVLYSWSLTEVGRYPMYLFPNSSAARYVRLVLPIVTFPLGAAAEAVGAYRALTGLLDGGSDATDAAHWTKVGLLAMVVLINGLLGPTMAYPALLRKGLPVLMGKADEKAKKKKTT